MRTVDGTFPADLRTLQDRLRVGSTVRVMVETGDHPIMNALGFFWLWVGSLLDYIYRR